MRLKKIKLAGFKSFVDPITVPINGSLIGIVGPNGCGKSNIIDAVRWVMGESSAKHLRGDSMADVIFSGSTSRKPVGKASVELIFDSSDGSAPGQYASYAEISIRREAGRDGQSDYFLNKTKCRRKDITDMFLGTGVGAHSYSILEQNAVNRIIESKPEELRGMFEEAAGVSRYKERRRETENRMKHTRENLARVDDIRKELETQLNRLQRQSRAAQKYKEFKAEERLVRAQLLTLRWQALNIKAQSHEAELATHETALQAAIAELRASEAGIEKLRVQQADAGDHFNKVQGEFYAAGAEISGLEQAIQHAHDTRQQHLREQEQLNRAWEEASRHLTDDAQKLEQLRLALETSTPLFTQHTEQRASLADSLKRAEQAMQEWQSAWETFGQQAAEPDKVRQIQGTRLKSLAQQMQQLQERQSRLQEELQIIEGELDADDLTKLRDAVGEHDRVHETKERELEAIETRIKDMRATGEQHSTRLEDIRGRKQSSEARLASLHELQSAALGKHDATLNQWLAQHSLSQAPRLAGMLAVEPGWEQAVERVLGADLAAVCVARLDDLAGDLEGLKQAELTVIETGAPRAVASQAGRARLFDKVRAETADLSSLLADIFVAESLSDAQAMRAQLSPQESVVTRSGVWLGRNWMAVTDKDSARAGILGREREIETLEAELQTLQADFAASQEQLTQAQTQLHALEQERDERRRQLNDYNRERAASHAKLGHREARHTQLVTRRGQIRQEQSEIAAQTANVETESEAARKLLQQAESQGGTLEARRAELLQQRDALRDALDAARSANAQASEALHRLEVEREAQRTAHESTQQGIARLEGQRQHLVARRTDLASLLAQEQQPEAEHQQRLESLLKQRMEIEKRLNAARQAAADMEAAHREQQQARQQHERRIEAVREQLEQERIGRQELVVRRDTLAEQVREAEFELTQVLAEMPAQATEDDWHKALDELGAKINRLGPINLVAIEEYAEHSERKGYLDKQNADLSEALSTLEDAIRKIDRETRTRFKDTFEKVNTAFQTLFPKLFGGGHAYLELVGEDLLDTGVRVMARPPGKRNSTIHLLSGGEKALTAVSLLFALFELNPAPFCLLDEVDAPLDDANVIRYSEMLKALSQKTQLVYITHNKISMEIAEYLLGVTMSEPGVSRLVAVDVQSALEMVAQ
jgi:chromosome segregation protein